eukprot:s1049_g1.t1
MFRRLGRLCAGSCAPFAGSAQVDTRRRPQEQDRSRHDGKLQVYDMFAVWPVSAVANGPTGAGDEALTGVLEAVAGGAASVETANHGDPLEGKPWPVILTFPGSEESQKVKDAWLSEAICGHLATSKDLGVRPARDRARSPETTVAEGPRDRTSSLVNAVLCYTLLEVLQRLGLPLLAFGRFWALLACVLFWLWHSIEPSRPPKKWNPRAEAANNEPVEVFLETPDSIPDAPVSEGAEVFIKFVKEPKMTTQVCLNIESHDQEPDFPWIVVENDKLAGGAVPIFLALELWPAWFPFCQTLAKIQFMDNLSSNGRLELLFASPPKGAKSWMGTVVPGRTASFRYVIPGMRLSIRPSTTRSGNIVLQDAGRGAGAGGTDSYSFGQSSQATKLNPQTWKGAETLDEVQIQWAVKLFWQACASRIIGLLSRMQRRYEGSTLQAHYAVETQDVQDQRRHFFKLEERIAQSYLRRHRARSAGTMSQADHSLPLPGSRRGSRSKASREAPKGLPDVEVHEEVHCPGPRNAFSAPQRTRIPATHSGSQASVSRLRLPSPVDGAHGMGRCRSVPVKAPRPRCVCDAEHAGTRNAPGQHATWVPELAMAAEQHAAGAAKSAVWLSGRDAGQPAAFA